MTVDLVLHNAKIYFHGELVDAGIAIENGRIVKVAKEVNLPPASMKMDLKGCLTLPGLIDVHVHLRAQQQAFKEDFYSGTAAAAAGGVTLVIDMPNNKPPTMSVNSLRARMNLAEKRVLVNVAFYSAFPRRIEEISSIVNEGAVAFKLFLAKKIGGLEIDDDEVLLQAFRAAKNVNVPVAIHAEDKETIDRVYEELRRAGRNDVDAYLKAHSSEVEERAVRRVTRLVEKVGVHVHFCHVSSEAGLNSVLTAKSLGLPVTCEVTPHHLFLSADDLKRKGTMLLTTPPLRSKRDVETLWKALKKGLIDVVASDHAPHTLKEKEAYSVWDVKPGVAGLETMLPLLLSQVNAGKLTISELVKLTSTKPAEIFNLENRGHLEKGCWADIVVVDLRREYKIDASNFHSKAKFSPFDGWKMRGKPVKTFVNGKLVMDEGEIVTACGVGHVIKRENELSM